MTQNIIFACGNDGTNWCDICGDCMICWGNDSECSGPTGEHYHIKDKEDEI